MEKLPNELVTKILEDVDYADCIYFRATSSKNYDVGNYVLSKKKTFDFRHYHDGIQNSDLEKEKEKEKKKNNCTNLNPSKMINFMEFSPNLRKIVLANLPTVFTLSDMIKLGKSLTNLQKCVIIQEEDQKWIGNDALIGLAYFESLENLKIVGWEPSYVTRRGCASRYEIIPQSTLRKLVNLTVICKQETVSKVLQHILDNEIVMTKCVKVKFDVRLSSPDIPHLIVKFFEFHPTIQKIEFNGFLFTTQDQVESFYNHILALPRVRRIRMENCSVIDRIEQSIQRTFLDALRRRGIQFTNLVQSLRHG